MKGKKGSEGIWYIIALILGISALIAILFLFLRSINVFSEGTFPTLDWGVEALKEGGKIAFGKGLASQVEVKEFEKFDESKQKDYIEKISKEIESEKEKGDCSENAASIISIYKNLVEKLKVYKGTDKETLLSKAQLEIIGCYAHTSCDDAYDEYVKNKNNLDKEGKGKSIYSIIECYSKQKTFDPSVIANKIENLKLDYEGTSSEGKINALLILIKKDTADPDLYEEFKKKQEEENIRLEVKYQTAKDLYGSGHYQDSYEGFDKIIENFKKFRTARPYINEIIFGSYYYRAMSEYKKTKATCKELESYFSIILKENPISVKFYDENDYVLAKTYLSLARCWSEISKEQMGVEAKESLTKSEGYYIKIFKEDKFVEEAWSYEEAIKDIAPDCPKYFTVTINDCVKTNQDFVNKLEGMGISKKVLVRLSCFVTKEEGDYKCISCSKFDPYECETYTDGDSCEVDPCKVGNCIWSRWIIGPCRAKL